MEIGGIPESIESIKLELKKVYSLVKPVKTM
jgi:hypothetical protein